eukprot:8506202-Pyramimonas_sp.AAC.1
MGWRGHTDGAAVSWAHRMASQLSRWPCRCPTCWTCPLQWLAGYRCTCTSRSPEPTEPPLQAVVAGRA